MFLKKSERFYKGSLLALVLIKLFFFSSIMQWLHRHDYFQHILETLNMTKASCAKSLNTLTNYGAAKNPEELT